MLNLIKAYIASHPELTVALELIFENVCQKCDEFERLQKSDSQNEHRVSGTDSVSKSPVQLTLDFLSTENLEELVEQRMKENKK
jgi:hypothetical protein